MESAKIKALLYADIFDYPLTEIELEKWQINDNSKFNPLSSLRAGNQKLKVEEAEGYFYLKGRKKIVKERLKREKISQTKLKRAQKAAVLLQKIPFIKLLALTGSLAMQNTEKNDDIDFLIITQKNTLWLTRFLATILLDLKGWRRKPESKNFRDKICLNMFLEDGHLALPVNEQDLYGAHEVYQIKPLFDKDNTYRRFLEANSWAKKFLPNAGGRGENKTTIPYTLNPLPYLEFLVKFFQLLYMRKRRTMEVILPHMLRFHPRDYRSYVLKRYAQKI